MDVGRLTLTVVGALIVLLVLSDVFMTVLFPASGHGPLREPLSRWSWRGLLALATHMGPERRRRLLAYSGPAIISETILVWLLLLVLGWALIYLPALGTGIVAAQGRTNYGLATALYVSGFTITTLGTGDVVPVSATYRLVVVTEAAVGFSVFTLVLTYFLSTYGAITQRRTFGSELEHQTFGTGAAVRLIAGLADSDGHLVDDGRLGTIAAHLTELAETHTSYPVLAYFHYRHARYALPRMLLVSLEAVALIRSALPERSSTTLLRSPALFQLEHAGQSLLDELSPRGRSMPRLSPLEKHHEAWHRRFMCCASVLTDAGFTVVRDLDAGARRYCELRSSWDGRLRALAGLGGYDWGVIEVAV